MRGGGHKKMPRKSKKKSEKNKEMQDEKLQPDKYEELKTALTEQLITHNNYNKVTRDLIDKYIEYTKIEDSLIIDIKIRGVNVEWNNGGGQNGVKKNDSIAEATKVNAQKIKILDKLGIKAPEPKAGDEDYEV